MTPNANTVNNYFDKQSKYITENGSCYSYAKSSYQPAKIPCRNIEINAKATTGAKTVDQNRPSCYFIRATKNREYTQT